jgi:ketosteroid isomerase-like protein
MKAKLKVLSIIFFLILISGCKQKEEEVVEVEDVKIDLLNNEFVEAQKEITETFGAIAQSLKDGDLDKLISFHAYGPKFTEFKNGEPRNGSEANETFERNTFGAVTEVVKFDANDMQIAVYGDVANVTFHSDFHLMFGKNLVVVNDQISLLFLKTDAGWKIVSEHHSPLKKGES